MRHRPANGRGGQRPGLGASLTALVLAVLVAACQDRSPEPAHPEPLHRDPTGETREDSPNVGPSSPIPTAFSTERRGPAPTLDQVRRGRIRGRCRGRDFVARSVFFEPRFNNWALVIADREPQTPLALLPPGTESIQVTHLPERMATGRYEKPLSAGGGFWQMRSAARGCTGCSGASC